MQAFIYRCSRKPDMYIYLAAADDFSKVPEAIMKSLGQTEFVMELDINAERKLAREHPQKIMQNLDKNGFHLQLPAQTATEEIMQRLTRNQ